ncbi:hypothetical protein C5167_008242 [Papaver somniferum]|uniref:Uncharacterized protein n=1 Tax=Papaver somniferum TaxID=3469 RepID=A0A4Y7JXW5_PAPSO|nr:hypothetical protein C5167_008242 [Papaver somniferum]
MYGYEVESMGSVEDNKPTAVEKKWGDELMDSQIEDRFCQLKFQPYRKMFVTSKIACCAQEPSNGIRLCTVATKHCFDRDCVHLPVWGINQSMSSVVTYTILELSNHLSWPFLLDCYKGPSYNL